MAMINRYNISKSELDSKAFESGALYVCTDTGDMYLDSPVTNSRITVSNNIIILSKESDKPLAPIAEKVYLVQETGSQYMYLNGKWYRIGGGQLAFFNVIVPANGFVNVSDSRITNTDTATFYPDASIADLVTASTCTCSDGSVKVACTCSNTAFGTVLIN